MKRKVVFVIGAGSTYSDSGGGSLQKKPPLDGGFFNLARRVHPLDTNRISRFFSSTFDIDIYSAEHDRLEHVMAMLYADIFHPSMGKAAFNSFRVLVKLYNRRIAETTNSINPSSKKSLFKLIAHHLKKVESPVDIDFVTFNQDIHIERTLLRFEEYGKYKNNGRYLWFPHCYGLNNPTTTSPKKSSVPRFVGVETEDRGPRIFKLHGSLNWYSTHNTPNISQRQIFNPKRRIHITSRSSLETAMIFPGKKKSTHCFPIIVPPVSHKAGIMHEQLQPLWGGAEKALREATYVVIFGYSCPVADVESANLLRRGIHNNGNTERISIVNPDRAVVQRYMEVLDVDTIRYSRTAEAFLASEEIDAL